MLARASRLRLSNPCAIEVDHGWPLIWCRRSYATNVSGKGFAWHVVRYSLPALAGNLAVWLLISALAGMSCEWYLRRRLHYDLVGVGDLRALAALPRLKALDLSNSSFVDDRVVYGLTSLRGLEELAIDDDVVSARLLEILPALKRLRALHICCDSGVEYDEATSLPLDGDAEMLVPECESDRCRKALTLLRHSNPGIVIDDATTFDERHGFSDLGQQTDYFYQGRPAGWGFFWPF
jgi:hypothetical protein